MMLTAKQQQRIENMAKWENPVSFYVADSLTAESWTLRASWNYIDEGRYGKIARSSSTMILSVVRPIEDDGGTAYQKFCVKCDQAKSLYYETRGIQPPAPPPVVRGYTKSELLELANKDMQRAFQSAIKPSTLSVCTFAYMGTERATQHAIDKDIDFYAKRAAQYFEWAQRTEW